MSAYPEQRKRKEESTLLQRRRAKRLTERHAFCSGPLPGRSAVLTSASDGSEVSADSAGVSHSFEYVAPVLVAADWRTSGTRAPWLGARVLARMPPL